MKGGYVFLDVERIKAVKSCQYNKELSIGTAGSTNLANVRTIKIASTVNGVREHWEAFCIE